MVSNAVCEYLDDTFAILRIFIMDGRFYATHQVGVPCLQIVEGISDWFQLNLVRNVQFLEDESQQVDIVADWFTRLTKKRVWPQVPCILVDQGVLLCVDACSVFWLCLTKCPESTTDKG